MESNDEVRIVMCGRTTVRARLRSFYWIAMKMAVLVAVIIFMSVITSLMNPLYQLQSDTENAATAAQPDDVVQLGEEESPEMQSNEVRIRLRVSC